MIKIGNVESLFAVIAIIISAIYLVSTTLSETYKFHFPKQTDEITFKYIMTSKKIKQLDIMIVVCIIALLSLLISSVVLDVLNLESFSVTLVIVFYVLIFLLLFYERWLNKQRDRKIMIINYKDEGPWYLYTQTDDDMFLFKKEISKSVSQSDSQLLLLKKEEVIKYYAGLHDKETIKLLEKLRVNYCATTTTNQPINQEGVSTLTDE